MQLFDFQAKDQNGVPQKGKVEARDIEAAASTLREKQLVIIKLKPANQENQIPFIGAWMNRLKSEDLVAFTQQLSTMINAGLPLSDGLSILQVQSKPTLARNIGEMTRDIQGGSTFAGALEARKGLFSKVFISAIKAGEASGKLDEVMMKLADTEEKRREFASKTKGALVYPIIVIIVMAIVMAIMMVAVIPKMLDIFKEFGTELPMSTKILIAVSEFAQKSWWIILIAIIGGMKLLQNWYKTKKGRQAIDQFVLKIPVYGTLKTQIALADITRTMALLTAAGISILETLEIVSDATDNVVFEQALISANKGVEKGLPLATMLAREQVFPPLLSQMVSVGEETGKLSQILVKVAQFYERESEHAVKNLTTAIEPLIMVVLGVGVGFLVFAIITPIYTLTGSF